MVLAPERFSTMIGCPKRLLQIRLQQASDNVLRCAGLRRHDDANGPAWVIVGEGAGNTGEHEECDAGQASPAIGQSGKENVNVDFDRTTPAP